MDGAARRRARKEALAQRQAAAVADDGDVQILEESAQAPKRRAVGAPVLAKQVSHGLIEIGDTVVDGKAVRAKRKAEAQQKANALKEVTSKPLAASLSQLTAPELQTEAAKAAAAVAAAEKAAAKLAKYEKRANIEEGRSSKNDKARMSEKKKGKKKKKKGGSSSSSSSSSSENSGSSEGRPKPAKILDRVSCEKTGLSYEEEKQRKKLESDILFTYGKFEYERKLYGPKGKMKVDSGTVSII
mmetsp:Transcript_128455/g.256600  ORF Transcript_128455/g.256600 Transcript_128455/m.256600 type:complete len:243 (-) Transcript_128455:57-785(-)